MVSRGILPVLISSCEFAVKCYGHEVPPLFVIHTSDVPGDGCGGWRRDYYVV